MFSFGQSINQQIWSEYMLNMPFGKAFNVEHAFSYSTLLNTPRWHAFDYAATLEYSINPYVDVMVAGIVSYTHQTESYNTVELRPVLGTRLRFTPEKRLRTALLLRFEQRNVQNLDTKDWETVFRPRVRAELVYPFNKSSLNADKVWYGVADAEALFGANDVQERFANRFRTRFGLGYKLNYSMRFEVMFMLQRSRNELDHDFESSDHIIRLRFKQFLHKKPQNNPMGVGN